MPVLSTRSRAFVGAAGVVAGATIALIGTAIVDDNDTGSTQSFAQIPAECVNGLTLEVPDKGTIYWCDLAPTTTEETTSTTEFATTSSTGLTTSSTSTTIPATTTTAQPTTSSSTIPPTTSTSSTSTTQPPTTSTTTAPTPSGLDALLRPPPGTLLNGVEWEGGGYNGWVAEAGEAPHIFHRYSTSGATFVSALNSVPQGMIPLINFKPTGGMGLTAYNTIINGQANAAIDTAADAVIAYSKPMFVVIMHEPENDGTATSDDEYAAAFRYTVERMRARGAGNAVFVWNMMGIPNHGSRYNALYPGDDVVDWIGADLYIMTSTTVDTWAELVNNKAGGPADWPGFYEWAEPKGKPMMWAEWGIGSAVVPVTPTKMFGNTEMTNLTTDLPLIKALVYWNEPGSSGYQVTGPNWPNNMLATWVDRPEFQVDISAVAK